MATRTLSETQSAAQVSAPPYPPSWLDRLQDWVERLPVPYWVTYTLLGVIFLVPLTLVHWQVGGYPAGAFNLFHIWLAFEPGIILAWMHYLDRVAAQALVTARPTLDFSDAEYSDTEYRLTHLPARSTLIASVIGLLAGAFFLLFVFYSSESQAAQIMQSVAHPFTVGVGTVLLAATWAVYAAWFVHTIHQLKLINRIYTGHTRLNMYNPGPIYAFSGVTARSAILFMLVPTLWFVTDPAQLSTGFVAGILAGIVLAGVALTVFILPLWGIHKRLVQAKDELLGQAGTRIQNTTTALHQITDTQAWDNATKIKDAILGLETEQRIIEKMPTWPWAPGAFRILLTAILLPIILFVIQFVIQRFLTP